MINKIVSGLGKFFGQKSDKDIAKLQPIVDAINEHYNSYNALSDDELRGKTDDLRNRIKDHLSEIDNEISSIKNQIDEIDSDDLMAKDTFFDQIDQLEKNRNEELEVILKELLPEAFAIVKDTARRLTENLELNVTANENDRELAVSKEYVTIKGDNAIYANKWTAAGAEITWNMIHYDVQLIGGIVLHEGKIAEMATGEGKTLVSTLPAFLNALGKRGVHLVTVNDYLAKRDSEWNAPLFEFHGLSVDCIDKHQPNSEERKQAYLADITYGTNNEFGFDYLRDNMVHSKEEMVQRPHHYAMIDEVDSVLVDDARTPLIISGPVPKGDIHEFYELKPRVEKVVKAQKQIFNGLLNDAKRLIAEGNKSEKEGGGGLALFRAYRGLPKNKALIKFLSEPGMKQLLTKVENTFLADNMKQMPIADAPLYFTIEEKNNAIDLTDKGIELISEGKDNEFFILPDMGGKIAEIEKNVQDEEGKLLEKERVISEYSEKSERIHSVNQLLKAYTLFEIDDEYIVQDGKVKIVDEQTGRVLDGRRYSDGLHQAIEAKENVKVEASTQTYATITLQNFFRMYHKLAGMTGTAETEAGELWEIYKLDVIVIPTNKPIIRDDRNDLIYKTVRSKFNAVIEEVEALTAAGRPVLVGTTSVETSELLSRMLKMKGIKHNVLNAKQHQREAEIVAEAGKPSAVTIATNMAGRGTDIKISEEVKEAGGLAIIGTERHDSRRVDRQLRGRAGRQGDPGSSQFFVSMEDDLMRLFGGERASSLMDKFGFKEDEVIEHPWMNKNIENAQRKVEQNSFATRKHLLEYDDVMNKQRSVIYKRRRNALFGDRLESDLGDMLYDWCANQIGEFKDVNDFEGFKMSVIRELAVQSHITEEEFESKSEDHLTQQLYTEVSDSYKRKSQLIKEEALPVLQRVKSENEQVENIIIPITDGKSTYRIVTDLDEAIKTEGKDLILSLEKFSTLSTIDNEWKDYLRELDDLRQAVRNAQHEQKDPLLIYKLESFELFKALMSKLNTEVLSKLLKSKIDGSESDSVKEARDLPKNNNSQLQTSRTDNLSTNSGSQEKQKVPVRAEKKIGRNEPCFCGSGKKFKHCHGK
jgi:preprotein translocase subunit SecA